VRFLLKTLFVPGTRAFLVLVLAVNAPLLLWRPSRRWSAIAIGITFGIYAILAMPLVADTIAAPLLATPAPDSRGLTRDPAAALVMLAGDNTDGRVKQTLDVFRRIDPALVILSGFDYWSGLALQESVPAGRLIVLTQSRTTREQALDLQPVLAAHAVRRVYLVASGLQTRRALATFDALHVHVIPIPSPLDYIVRRAGAWRVLPQRAALHLSSDAIYEYGALLYYRWQRWLPAGAAASRAAQRGGPDLASLVVTGGGAERCTVTATRKADGAYSFSWRGDARRRALKRLGAGSLCFHQPNATSKTIRARERDACAQCDDAAIARPPQRS
jgi:uncharacterized SAM-binding protein YcdF (DUF218 family)